MTTTTTEKLNVATWLRVNKLEKYESHFKECNLEIEELMEMKCIFPSEREFVHDYLMKELGIKSKLDCTRLIMGLRGGKQQSGKQERWMSDNIERLELADNSGADGDGVVASQPKLYRPVSTSSISSIETTPANILTMWSGYFRKTLPERQAQVKIVFPDIDMDQFNYGCLPPQTANIMIENCIGVLGLPIGISPNFIINGQHYIVPMCVEEPSIIAAVSSIAKLVATKADGFATNATGNVMTALIQLMDIPVDDLAQALSTVQSNEADYIKIGNEFCRSMVKRGGGVCSVEPRIVYPRYTGDIVERDAYLVVNVNVDVCEAMGANVVNTVAEGLSTTIASDLNARAALRILSNLCLGRRAVGEFQIPLRWLGWKGVSGADVAKRVMEAYHFALDDEFRATTNNKGVMNGIDAVCIAVGQDFRAIEAAAHAYACKDGFYAPMAHYRIDDKTQCLVGRLELPIAVGSKGGALQTHPGYKITHKIMGFPSSREIAQILVCVGLAQNFAAIRALAVEGIQRGHMSLHARNIASAAGVPTSLIEEVATYMIERKTINSEAAMHYLEARNIFNLSSPIVIGKPNEKPRHTQPSTLFVELPTTDGLVSINIVMPTRTPLPLHLILSEKAQPKSEKLCLEVFGKPFQWFVKLYQYLDLAKLHASAPSRSNFRNISQLKLNSVLINCGCGHLMQTHPKICIPFLTTVIGDLKRELNGLISGDSTLNANPSVLVKTPSNPQTERHSATIFEFQTAPLRGNADNISDNSDNGNSDSDRTLPFIQSMICALLSSLFYRLQCTVYPSHPTLAEHILREQITILETLIYRNDSAYVNEQLTTMAQSATLMSPWDKCRTVTTKISKRWQIGMILLCDAINVSPAMISHKRLQFISKLGAFFEFTASIVHDLARARRASDEANNSITQSRSDHKTNVNMFLHWLRLSSLPNTIENVNKFLKLFRNELHSMQSSILEFEKSEPEINHFFDTSIFLDSMYYIQHYYNQKIGIRRKQTKRADLEINNDSDKKDEPPATSQTRDLVSSMLNRNKSRDVHIGTPTLQLNSVTSGDGFESDSTITSDTMSDHVPLAPVSYSSSNKDQR